MRLDRVALCLLVVLVRPAVAAPVPQLGVEPGLTARVAQFAMAKMPESARAQLQPFAWLASERLQSLPPLAGGDPAEQLALIFKQAGESGLTADMLASAARAAVRLSLPEGDGAFVNLKTAVALRSELSEVDLGVVPSVKNAASFAAELAIQGKALAEETTAASSDASKLAPLRGRAASLATRSVMGVWVSLLPYQKKPAEKSAETPTAGAGNTAAPQGGTDGVVGGDLAAPPVNLPHVTVVPVPVSPVVEPEPEPAPPPGPRLPVRYIGNSNSKKFHRLDCRFLPAPANQVPFPSRDDALRQGFQPCKVCKP